MLVSFSVSNFRSFGEEVTLNMVASNKLADHKHHLIPVGSTGKHLVRTALVYGANAAGKSNLVKAMAFAQSVVGWGQRPKLSSVEFFRFQPEATETPSSFEFRFLIDERVFVYGFDVTRRGIAAEWLMLNKGDDEIEVFSRRADGTTSAGAAVDRTFRDDPNLSQTLSVLTRLRLRPRQLFLNRVSSLPEDAQGPTLAAVLRWITEDLRVLEPEYRSCELLDRLYSDNRFRQFSEEFLQNVDTGISSLKFDETERDCTEYEREYIARCTDCEETPYEMFGCTGDMDMRLKPGDPNKVVVRRLLAEHRTSGRTFLLPFCEESQGTQQLLHFMPVLFTSRDENKVVVIDELDRSLHPLLCWEFIRFFSEHCPGARTQLIVTTHEAHLLDQELLRRDEYWFAEKDEKQQSQLVPLSEFNIRKDLQVGKGYLDGRFGAIPIFGMMEGLRKRLECETDEGADATQEAPA
jgi:hypothetical protein